MYRFLIILGLIVYAIYKIGSLFYRAGAASQQFRNNTPPARKRSDGEIHIDHDPRKKNGGKKDGEYIDYEEIK